MTDLLKKIEELEEEQMKIIQEAFEAHMAEEEELEAAALADLESVTREIFDLRMREAAERGNA